MAEAAASGLVLLTGVTGFVGSRVYPALEARGLSLVGGTRDPERAARASPGRRFRRLELSDPTSVREALTDCRAAVYLVHSMASSDDYEATELRAAQIFRDAAAAAGLERIVYLGGMPPNGTPSRHLRSRMLVGETLRSGQVPTIELQATMILGAGGESFRMVRDLAARLPVMLLPSWSNSQMEPIGIDDVVFAIGTALVDAPAVSRAYPLPGPEIMSARQILERTALLMGRRVRMMHLPLITPKLSSYWIRLVTRTDHRVADELVEGLRTDILAPDAGFWKLVPAHRCQRFDDAVQRALDDEIEGLSTGALIFEHAIDRITPKRQEGPLSS